MALELVFLCAIALLFKVICHFTCRWWGLGGHLDFTLRACRE